MYVQFKKDHPIGIKKGLCKKVDEAVALKFVKEGYAEKITVEEYQDWLTSYKEAEMKLSDKKMKEAEGLNEKRSETVPKENGEGEMTKGKKKVYHTLTDADIEINKDYIGDLVAGDEVLLDDKGDLAVANGKLIKKGN